MDLGQTGVPVLFVDASGASGASSASAASSLQAGGFAVVCGGLRWAGRLLRQIRARRSPEKRVASRDLEPEPASVDDHWTSQQN